MGSEVREGGESPGPQGSVLIPGEMEHAGLQAGRALRASVCKVDAEGGWTQGAREAVAVTWANARRQRLNQDWGGGGEKCHVLNRGDS